jgi:DNA-binding SARP family transcriptional activator
LSLKNDYLDAYALKAQIEQAGGDTTAAVTEMTQYTRVAPYDDQGYLLLGQAELQNKDYPDAIAAFAEAYDLAPTNPSDYLQYINALEAAGQNTQAIAALQDFKAKFPQVQGVDAEIKRLQSVPVTPKTTATTTSTRTTKK